MKKKNTNLQVVKPLSEEQEAGNNIAAEWEKNEKSWRITRGEVRHRVADLRIELDRYRDYLDGAAFDIACGNMSPPRSLEYGERKYIEELVTKLNPRVKRLFDAIDEFAGTYGCHNDIDFNAKLFSLKSECAETAFTIGLLAGAIMAGLPKEQIDRYERGLCRHMELDNRLVERGE